MTDRDGPRLRGVSEVVVQSSELAVDRVHHGERRAAPPHKVGNVTGDEAFQSFPEVGRELAGEGLASAETGIIGTDLAKLNGDRAPEGVL